MGIWESKPENPVKLEVALELDNALTQQRDHTIINQFSLKVGADGKRHVDMNDMNRLLANMDLLRDRGWKQYSLRAIRVDAYMYDGVRWNKFSDGYTFHYNPDLFEEAIGTIVNHTKRRNIDDLKIVELKWNLPVPPSRFDHLKRGMQRFAELYHLKFMVVDAYKNATSTYLANYFR